MVSFLPVTLQHPTPLTSGIALRKGGNIITPLGENAFERQSGVLCGPKFVINVTLIAVTCGRMIVAWIGQAALANFHRRSYERIGPDPSSSHLKLLSQERGCADDSTNATTMNGYVHRAVMRKLTVPGG